MMFVCPGSSGHDPSGEFSKVAAGILLSSRLLSFLTGVTEPIEFRLLFVARAVVGHWYLPALSW